MDSASGMSIGERIALERKLRGLTQEGLAMRLHRSKSWDCSEMRSATRVIPGSQLLALVGMPNNGGTWMDEHEVYVDLMDQWVPVPASAGDILLLDSLVLHGGGLALGS